jgi:hypothetical protein
MTDLVLIATNLGVAKDDPTWDREVGASYTRVGGTPICHDSLKVSIDHLTPVERRRN